ncbi:MAG: hypothetical protein H6733_14595 [Alphaproteobacteria bacterium]|nr:hypothetical protein [Alphaproteobacteria bacterium]
MSRAATVLRTLALLGVLPALVAAVPGEGDARREATPDEQAVLTALATEMARAQQGLALPDSPPLYLLRFKLLALDSQQATASRGALVGDRTRPLNLLGAEVRVGAPSYDNTGFGGWRDGFGMTGLTRDAAPDAARTDAWRLVDGLYKDALEQYSRKQAQAVLPPEHPGDYTMLGDAVWVDPGWTGAPARVPATPALPDGAARALALDVSGAMAGAGALEVSRVDVGLERGLSWTLDTEGLRRVAPVQEATVRATAWWVAPDGQRLADQRLWTARTVDDLPPVDAMAAEAAAMASEVVAWGDAPRWTDEYVGPVVFEDQAAADLFRWLLVPQLRGTPPRIPFDSFLGELGGGDDGARLLRRVLPDGWTVTDDPTADPHHPGSYTVDAEGVPARAVVAVRDGIVRELFTSRVPRKDEAGSNGHARASLSDRAEGAASLTTVVPDRALALAALHRKALRAAAAYGLDHVVVVRRLQAPSLAWLDDPEAWSRDDVDGLPDPVVVERLYADGRVERVRGARFAGVDRRVLREIVAAGPPVTMDYLSSTSGDDGSLGPTDGTPCRMTAPAVIVGELEIVPAPRAASRAPRLPPPG